MAPKAWYVLTHEYRKCKSIFAPFPPPSAPAGGHAVLPARAAPPARGGRPAAAARSQVERDLDTRLGMGEGSASEVPWGAGRGQGRLGSRLQTGLQTLRRVRYPIAARTSPTRPRALA